ncbi:hypothetical protein OKW12_004874 [Pseudomonas silensiensis]|nr:hypothetical protein [Pseudomonas silensiensis]
MINIINSIFTSSNFKPTECDKGTIYTLSEEQKKSFWLVVTAENTDVILEQQSRYFDRCKESISDPALEKNLSLLILHRTNNLLDSTLKQKILEIEENPYFFKKTVLYFTQNELDSLLTISTSIDMDFLGSKISSKTVFTAYKDNLNNESWQSLLYRLAIKIPFIKLNLGFADSLEDLHSKNLHALAKSKNSAFNDNFFSILSNKSIAELKNTNPVDLLENLSAAIED